MKATLERLRSGSPQSPHSFVQFAAVPEDAV
jgi:hypothetical protein